MNRPVSASVFSDLVGAIYECAVEPSLWPDVLGALAAEMSFRVASLTLLETPGGRALVDITVGFLPEEHGRMGRHGASVPDAWGGLDAIMALPLDEPHLATRVNRQAEDSPDMRSRAMPFEFVDALTIAFSRGPCALSLLGFGRHRDEGPVGEAELAMVRLFAPHVKRSLSIGRFREAQAVEQATCRDALDGLAVAVLLVGSDLRLLHANLAGEAMLRAGDPLGQRHGRVTGAAGLGAALAVAVDAEAARIGGGRERGRVLGVPARRGDGAPLALHVVSLGDARRRGGAAATVFVATAATPPRPFSAVAALFDLTPAEARVMELLCAGSTPLEAAAALGVAASKVRTHILRLFDKTGKHRQSDLVALLAALSLPLR